jgi:hypothetical protein
VKPLSDDTVAIARTVAPHDVAMMRISPACR